MRRATADVPMCADLMFVVTARFENYISYFCCVFFLRSLRLFCTFFHTLHWVETQLYVVCFAHARQMAPQ